MRLFIVTGVFPPERVTSAFTARDIAEELSKRGHEVIVLTTFPNRPAGEVYDGYRRSLIKKESRSGYTVIHSWHTLSNESTMLSRGLENATFGFSSSLALALVKNPDIVYMNTFPIVSQNMNAFVLGLKKVPIVCTIQDIYPETLTNKGILSEHGLVAKGMRNLDARFLRKCALVTTLSDGMRSYLIGGRGLSGSQVKTIPNWLESASFEDDLPLYGEFRRRHGIAEDSFVAMFAGSLTMSAGVELYVEAAEKLRGVDQIQIVLAGDGSRREWIEGEKERRNLHNLRVLPLIPEEVPQVQAGANVLLLSLTGDAAQNAAPSKQVAYMFSGRPTLASVSEESTAAKIVERAGAGVIVPPDSPQAVADQLVEWASNAEGLEEMGRNARRYAIEHFSRQIVLPQLVDLLEGAAVGTYSGR